VTSRRKILWAAAALSASCAGRRWPATGAAPVPWSHAVCNELFEKMDFAESCRLARSLGYRGLEIAPFTLAESVEQIPPARRRELRDIMRSEGIEFAGLHWLLVTPKWLHVTTADRSVRERSWDYFRRLIELAGELGQPSVMVLGSPKQRGSRGGSREEATAHLTEGLAAVAPEAAAARTTICLEALDHGQTDVVNTLDEAAAVVRQVGHPAVQSMFDYHNVGDETEPLDVLVRRHYPIVRHIHINEMDGRHPGTGQFDFLPVLRVLAEKGYRGWVSLEVFDFKLGAERIGREAMEHIRKLESRLG
jgi:sugar phosphate isomerase/epimerase